MVQLSGHHINDAHTMLEVVYHKVLVRSQNKVSRRFHPTLPRAIRCYAMPYDVVKLGKNPALPRPFR